MRKLLSFLVRFPLRFALGAALAIVAIGGLGGWLLTGFGERASLSVHAVTESVAMENVCDASSIDLPLPPGTMRRLVFDEQMDAPEIIETVLDQPSLLRVSGAFKLVVRRRAHGPMTVTIGPATSESNENETRWSAQLFGAPAIASAEEFKSLQLTFDAAADAAGVTTLPLAGKVVVGEAVSAHHGALSQSVPRSGHLLLEGSIRVRAPTWGVDAQRIDLSEHVLEMGDVVSTAFAEPDPTAFDSSCVARQAQGSVRLHHDGALQTIAHVDQDYVTVARGRDIRVGASTVQMLAQQPLVTLAWQVAIILFAIVGLVQQFFEIITFYTSRREAERERDARSNGGLSEDAVDASKPAEKPRS